jgi:hypothetical protein
MNRRRHHPQVIRAKEMAREAGLNPYASIAHFESWRSVSVYSCFMDAAFDEHFERTAVDNIYWDEGGSFYTDQWDIPWRDGECAFSYGRCRSGQRWFWTVHGWAWGHHQTGEGYLEDSGFAATEEGALFDGTAAIKGLSAGRRVIVHYSHQSASHKLKKINAEKRRARPPSDAKGSRAIEYLYSWRERYRIIKRTKQRVYYLKDGEDIDEHGDPIVNPYHMRSDDEVGFITLTKLKNGSASGYRWLYPSLEEMLAEHRRDEPEKPDLAALKAAMADAHPDRGGSSAEFIAARQAYVAARRQLRERRGTP